MSNLVEIISNMNGFDSIVKNTKVPILAKFYASWCGPCRMLSPIFEQLSRDFEGKVKFIEIDVDNSDGLSERFSVYSVPTMIILKNGLEFDRLSGLAPYDSISSFIKRSYAVV